MSNAPVRVQSKPAPSWIDQRALEVAKLIEDAFARAYEGGTTQRRAAIQILVFDAMMAARGDR